MHEDEVAVVYSIFLASGLVIPVFVIFEYC